MLDIKFLRENPEVVKQNIRNKFQDQKLGLVDQVIALDKENREIKQEVEALRQRRISFQTDRRVDGAGQERGSGSDQKGNRR